MLALWVMGENWLIVLDGDDNSIYDNKRHKMFME